jgi:fibronectin type 3 domain-containing protein
MAERDQFGAGVGSGIYGSGEPVGNIVFPSPKLPKPENLVATNNIHLDKVSLTWNSVNDASYYNVYRDFIFLQKVSSASYNDTTAIEGKIYNYSVTAVNNSSESDQSNIDTGSRKINGVQNLTASQTLPTTINLSWDSKPNAINYTVYRGLTSNLQSMIILTITSSNSYTDSVDLVYGTTYFYRIVPISQDGDGAESESVSGFLFVDSPTTPSANVSYGTYEDKVIITWNSIPTATNYRVYRDGVEINNTTTLTYTDTTIQQGIEYSYLVLSENQAGLSTYTTDDNNTGWAKLSSPQSLTAADGQAVFYINLNWSSVQNATHYNIYRRLAVTGASYSLIDSVQTFSYTDTNTDLIYGSTYVYKVRAACYINGVEKESNDSNEDTGILKNPIPNAPVIIATSGDYNDKISLSWNSVEHGSQYIVYRDSQQIAVVSDTTYDDIDVSISSCTNYAYKVKARTIFGDDSVFSNTDIGYKKLQTPSGLSATDSEYTGKIRVSWNSVPNALNYTVYRSLYGTEASMVPLVTVSVGFYDDTNTDLVYGTEYYYAVKANCICVSCSTNDDTSEFSNIDSGILKNMPTQLTPPNAPTTLTIAQANTTSIQLTWSSVSNVTGYKIFRDGTQIAQSSTTTYSDTPTPGIQYTYTVKSYNSDGESSSSSPSATGYIILSAPKNVSATKNSNSTESYIRVTWSGVPGATSYKVFRKTATSSFVQIDTTANTTYDDTNTDLLYNIIYTYRVTANSSLAIAESANSSITSSSSGILKSPPPSSFSISSASSTYTDKVIVTWNSSEYSYGGYSVSRDSVPLTNGYSSSNFLTYSNTFQLSNSDWILYNNSSISSSPQIHMPTDDTNDEYGKVLTFNSTANNGIYQTITNVASSTQYTLSCYVRSVSGTSKFRMSYFNGSASSFSDEFTAETTPQRFAFTFTTTTSLITSNIAIGNNFNIGINQNGQQVYIWEDGTIVIWGAQLERGSVATTLIPTTTAPVTSTTYTDTTATYGVNHLYTVTALNNITSTNSSNSVNGSLKLLAPTLNSVSSNLSTKVTLNWSSVSAASTYKVYRGTTSSTSSMSLLSSGISTTSYDDTTATAGTTYYYSIKATTSFSTDSDFGNVLSGSKVLQVAQPGDIFENYFSHNKYDYTNVTLTDSNKTNVTFNHFTYESFYNPMAAINWNSLQRDRDNRYTKQIFYSNKLSSTNNEINYLEKIIVHNFSNTANSFSGTKLYKNFDVYRGEGNSQYDDIICTSPNYTELGTKTVETILQPK